MDDVIARGPRPEDAADALAYGLAATHPMHASAEMSLIERICRHLHGDLSPTGKTVYADARQLRDLIVERA